MEFLVATRPPQRKGQDMTTEQTLTIPWAAVADDDRTLLALVVENEGPESMREAAIRERFVKAGHRLDAEHGRVTAAGRKLVRA